MSSILFPGGEEGEGLVREYIDNTLTALLCELCLSPSEGHPSITLRRRPKATSTRINPRTGALEADQQEDADRIYTWPGGTAMEAWRFTVVIRVLAIIDQALRTGKRISKRDIYYIDPAYFRSQGTVNGVVDDLAYTIGVDRAALNVEAAGKGLIAGSFRLWRDSELVMNAQTASQDTLVPRIQDGDEIDIVDARWVLVIEKEAVFHRLVQNGFHTHALAGKGILITGKGYPDLCTRTLCRRIFDAASAASRKPRFYALVDADPDGIAIMSTYKYGSLVHAHDNARLCVPGLQWLGLRISDAIRGDNVSSNGDLVPLTGRDRRKIITMLRNGPVLAVGGPEPEWRTELQQMLMLNVKAEIELLYEQDGGLEAWINRKMFRQA